VRLWLLGLFVAVSVRADVLVEAESFQQLGGWVVDQQFMDVMGSPYLLAHGMGRPVERAKTTVRFPGAGTYRVWVRTRDWVAPHGPGKFRLHVDGKLLERTFGIGDGAWHWEDGGPVEIKGATATLELEDLTGFEGRCDAILFADRPSDNLRKPPIPTDGGEYDLVVVGGGYAGTCAAIAAARLGLTVALIQDRPVLGGNASGEIRVGPIGKMGLDPFPANADIMKEIHAASSSGDATGGLRPKPNDVNVERLVRQEKNIALFLETHATAVEKDGARIKAVVAQHVRTGQAKRFRGKLFADCTGDGTIGFLAGAEYRMGREGRDETSESLAPEKGDKTFLGMSNFWTVRHTEQTTTFPACSWALNITEESVEVSTPKYPVKLGKYAYAAGWNWESGFNRDPILEAEAVRDHNFRAIYGTWDFLKNRSKDKAKYAKAELEWVAYIVGKRESRRLLGDVLLTEQDIRGPKVYTDGCVTATWYFDLHFPHPDNTKHFPGQEFRSIAFDDPNWTKPGKLLPIKPYPIPYRCFYSRNVPNLFMAGRNISVTHVALAPVRVMNTTGQMGAIVGRAAYLCRKFNADPRVVYEKHLDALKRLLADPKLIAR
jgi:hypothetical protein